MSEGWLPSLRLEEASQPERCFHSQVVNVLDCLAPAGVVGQWLKL